MAVHREKDAIVWDGFEKGIADSPYTGLGDLRCANIISTPGEAMVNFSTVQDSLPGFTGTVSSADAGADTVTYVLSTGTPTNRQAITFSASTVSGISTSTPYWIGNLSTNAHTFNLYSDSQLNNLVNITSDGTGTFTSIDMGRPTQWSFAISSTSSTVSEYFILDNNGRAWSFDTSAWIYLGNTTLTNASGNGMVWYGGYAPSNNGYLFVFRNSVIDYMNVSTRAWTYGWKSLTNSPSGAANSHYALVGQDNVVYFCNSSFVGSFFQKASATPFDPSNSATYTYTESALTLPSVETSTYLAELGVSLLVSGVRNLIYPWNRTATSFNFPIFLAEVNTQRMVTINTNTYLFTGNRGRIYVTNGTNAQLAFKVPDHISNTEDPLFTWGAVGFHKNQMYFGASVTTTAGVALTTYGGLWAIDLDTKAMRIVNRLSYGTYAGYPTVFIPSPPQGSGQAAGTSFYVGWDNGASGYGVDETSSNPYTNFETYVESDIVPTGTFLQRDTPASFEWKTSRPLVTGESVRLSIRGNLTSSFTTIGTSDTTSVGDVGGVLPYSPLQNMQWAQLKAELKSTTSSPSYVRLRQIRLTSTNH